MEALTDLIQLPPPAQLRLGFHLISGLLVLLVLFVGVLTVSTALSLLLRPFSPAAARGLSRLATRNRATWVVLGLLPLATLTFLLAQAQIGTALPVATYLARIALIFAAGFFLCGLYQRTNHPLPGVGGCLLLFGGGYHLTATITLLAYPEKWDLISSPLPFLYSVQPVIHFALVGGIALLVTGATILLMHFAWPERERELGVPEADMLRKTGWGASLAGALAVPPLMLWNLYTAPGPALGHAVYALSALLILVLLIAALLVFAMIRGGHTRPATPLFLLGVVAAGLLVYQGQAARASGARESRAALLARATVQLMDLQASREALYKPAEASVELGEQVYRERCTACHRLDGVVVGPAYNDVIPKYEGDLEGLTSFVLNPVRINDAFPAMPNQGLRRHEAESVGIYLMREVLGEEEGP